MRMPFAAGSVLALVLVAGCSQAVAEFKSGPQVGESVVPFEPLNVTGPFAGQKECLV
jgi:hypothetical protein